MTFTTTTTTEDAIKAAASVARDVADGRLTPAALEHQAVVELRQLFATVVGPGDPVWPLQVQIARGVLAVGGVPADELSEWLAVARQRAGEPLSGPGPDEVEPESVSLLSVALSPENADPGADVEPDADAEPQPVSEAKPEHETAAPVTTPRRADGYDPMRGWSPGRSRRS
ncbi:flagellar hook-length control protein [Mycobacterium paragordonae]|jgi:hypothetical protein|uniref:flagellar hook-length control protein n=1 Tax=Mycobacterium paragordonae TaxID=1389713 RepID=UPI0012E16A65|nr:flagellar hook-length control protein [Mycobacterium paragordonae]